MPTWCFNKKYVSSLQTQMQHNYLSIWCFILIYIWISGIITSSRIFRSWPTGWWWFLCRWRSSAEEFCQSLCPTCSCSQVNLTYMVQQDNRGKCHIWFISSKPLDGTKTLSSTFPKQHFIMYIEIWLECEVGSALIWQSNVLVNDFQFCSS